MAENSKENIYITTTLPYVNAPAHVGFALEIIQADVLSRLYRLLGHNVFFSTGVDEHGQKIYQKAQEEGVEVQNYTDTLAEKFSSLRSVLGVETDAFIRTTDARHISAAQEMWRRAEKAGDIYKKKYKGLYCVGCERFLTEKDVVDGHCPDHLTTELQEIEEENYFFAFSKYQEKLLEYLSEEGVVVPDFRRKEAISFVEAGLEDFSISRQKERMPWGISVPGDAEHVMYVWFDALTNYISVLGWPEDMDGHFDTFWKNGKTIQMAGKDQVRFQSLMFQAMLFSVGVENTDEIFYHGFITSGGQKMSKSIGNVIDPLSLVQEYGADALRYYMLRHVHPFDDSDMTSERFLELYNADLANGLGNLVSRVMQMAVNYEVEYTLSSKEEVWNSADAKKYIESIQKYDFNTALGMLWKMIGDADSFITTHEPFKVYKEDKEKAQELVRELVERIYVVSVLLEPVMSETSRTILEAIDKKEKPENLFARK